MKLVEILARELKEWPNDAYYIGQSMDRTLHIDNASGDFIRHTDQYFSMCDNPIGEYVTRAQWEAERARIYRETPLPNLDADAEAIIDDRCESTKKSRSKEDQALWDKVAISQMQALTVDGSYDFVRDYSDMYEESDMRKVIAATACDFADAFMAERAKRLDNSHTTNSTT